MEDVIPKEHVEQFVRSVAQFLKTTSAESTGMPREEREKLFKAIATDENARRAYAAARAALILPLLDTQSTVRSIYTPDPLPAGASPSYPISFDYTELAVVAGSLAGPARFTVEGDNLWIPPLKIDAGVEFPLDYAEDGRFNIGEDSTNLLKNRIIAKEEFVGWRTLRAAQSGVRADQTIGTAGIVVSAAGTSADPAPIPAGNQFQAVSLSGLNLMLIRMEQMQRQLGDLYMTPLRAGDIRTWTTTAIDYLTQREIIKNAGLPGKALWNMTMHTVLDSTLFGNGYVFGYDTRTVGKMPILSALKTYDNPVSILEDKVGIIGRERLGFGITDSWAMVCLRLVD